MALLLHKIVLVNFPIGTTVLMLLAPFLYRYAHFKGDISCRICVLGYKMLATTCDTGCGTIELEDKRGKKYCVACEEVDCEENR